MVRACGKNPPAGAYGNGGSVLGALLPELRDFIPCDEKLAVVKVVQLLGNFGVGVIAETSDIAEAGDKVHLAYGVVQRLYDYDFGPGSLIAVKITLQDGEFAEKAKFRATFWDMKSELNQRLAPPVKEDPVAKSEIAIERAQAAMQSFVALPVELRDDKQLQKAKSDLLTAVQQRSIDSILSCAGRVSERAGEVLRAHQAEITAARELESAAEAFLDQFGNC